MSRDEAVVLRAGKRQLPRFAYGGGTAAVVLGHLHVARVGLHRAVPGRAVTPRLRVAVLSTVAKVLHDLGGDVAARDGHGLFLLRIGFRAASLPVGLRAVEGVQMPRVAGNAPGSRVLEDERVVPHPEAPAVGLGLAQEVRLLVVGALRHPQRVRFVHARPVVGEADRLLV